MRIDNDKTQKEIADYLAIKQPNYYRYESGERDIPTEYLIKLADLFETSIDYLLERTDVQTAYSKKKNNFFTENRKGKI